MLRQKSRRAVSKHSKLNERGMATLELIPLLLIFIYLLAYSLGSFGIIHTGIMNSISARSYAFETFRNRANVTYFRDSPGTTTKMHYRLSSTRMHGIMDENRQESDVAYRVVERSIQMGLPISGSRVGDAGVHNGKVHEIKDGVRNEAVDVSPAWVMVQYGICLNNACGGD